MFTEEPYHIEPELRMGMPRPARIKPQAWAEVRVVAVIGLVIACLIGWFAMRDLSTLKTLQSHGITVQATITGKRESHGKSNSYYLTYTVWTHGVFIDDEDYVPGSLYEQTSEGDKMPVTFLPDHPKTHRLGRVGNRLIRQHEVIWAWGMLGGTGLFGMVIALMGFAYRKELRLARYGIPTPGCIGDCVAQIANQRTLNYTVTYQFMTPTGEQTHKRTILIEVGKLLSAGQTVTVLYDSANPRDSILYRALQYTEVK